MITFLIRTCLSAMLLCMSQTQPRWGFYAHREINTLAVYLLPQDVLPWYRPHIQYLGEHAPDPDKRRYMIAEEGPRHYIDLDLYGTYPFPDLPRKWEDALKVYPEDTLLARGIVPWHVQRVFHQLTRAFADKDHARVLKLSADLGHYIADAHVPLHTSHNHNGQYTDQHGIHGFWESRLPELFAEKEFDFFMEKAIYIEDPLNFIWNRLLESAAATDSVLLFEKTLSNAMDQGEKYAFEERNGKIIKQYASGFSKAYHQKLNGMVERRMRMAVFTVASFWYTAWVNAGMPNLSVEPTSLPVKEETEMPETGDGRMIGRQEED